MTPYVMDPTDENILYAGYKSIWKSTDMGSNWTKVSGALTTGNIQHIAIAPSNTDVVYVTDYSQIWKTTDGGSNWNLTGDPGSSIRSIAINDTDPNTLWVCVGNDVRKSTDGLSCELDVCLCLSYCYSVTKVAWVKKP